MSIYYSLLQLKVSSNCQVSNCQVTQVYRNAQDKHSLFSYKQMPGPKEIIEMDIWETPEILSSGNVTCSFFLGEVVRNTNSSFSAIRPWGNKHAVRSYWPESTEGAPKHEFRGTGYFKLQIQKINFNPLKTSPGSWCCALVEDRPMNWGVEVQFPGQGTSKVLG